MDALTTITDPTTYCDQGLKLRHKVQKLRWMGLDREADEIAAEIEIIEGDLPKALATFPSFTD